MFDMDGVLFDSMPLHVKAWHQTMLDMGLKVDDNLFYENEGRTGTSTFSIIFGREVDAEEGRRLYAVKSAYFDSYPKADPMKGAFEAVSAVRSCGADAIVVTGSGQKFMMERIGSVYPGLFRTDCLVCADDVTRGKPWPDPYLIGMRKAGCTDPREAMVVENAPLGVQSGKAAGCFVAAVNTGPLPDEVLLESGADVLYHTMYELAEDMPTILTHNNQKS